MAYVSTVAWVVWGCSLEPELVGQRFISFWLGVADGQVVHRAIWGKKKRPRFDRDPTKP